MILDSAMLAVFKLTMLAVFKLTITDGTYIIPLGICDREGTWGAETVIPCIICVNVMGEETEAQKEAKKNPRWHRSCDSGELSFP